MEWKDIYKSRLCSAEEALQSVVSGHRVIIPFAAGQPEITVKALAKRAEELENLTVAQLVTIVPELPYLDPQLEGRLHFKTSYVGDATRKRVNQGEGEFIPVFLYKFPHMWSQVYQPDVALIQITPPDKHGVCRLGVSVDHIKASVEYAKIVIAEVNPRMPRTHGDSFLHVSQITRFVEHEHPVLEVPRPAITDVEKQIGYHVASLIEDGSTLQLGIGAIPDAVLLFMKEKRDLGIHTEMFSDGVVDLVEAGVINNRCKTLHPNKLVATFLMGTSKFYDFVDDNPMVWMVTADYSNDPFVIAKNHKMVSINSAVQVDLMGQVAAESKGTMQISGVGGQVDFVRGAVAAPGGKSIIALPSTAKNGQMSRIVPLLEPGTPITTSRNDVDYVVTEYGVAHLRYKSLRERAKALIAIAHPDFKPVLKEALRKFNW